MKAKYSTNQVAPHRPQVQTIILRLGFQPNTRRGQQSALFRGMHAHMKAQGISVANSHNWVVCVPLDQNDVDQVRIDVSLWSLEQPQLVTIVAFPLAPVVDVLQQRVPLEPEDKPWQHSRRDLSLEEAPALLAKLCGHALNQALMNRGGVQ